MNIHAYTKSSKWISVLTELVSLIYFYAGWRNGIFKFLPVTWILVPSNVSKSKAVVKVFICHTDSKLILYGVYIWKRRLAQVDRSKHDDNLHC